MDNEEELLRYPVGRFVRPETWSAESVKEWRTVLLSLPGWLDAGIENLDHEDLQVPYREGGWGIQQLIHHIADSHMNAFIRLKLMLTEENPVIKPYKESAWAELPDSLLVPVNVSVTLVHALHRRMIALFDGLTPEQWERTCYHPERERTITAWEMAAMYAWHSRHHAAHIRIIRNKLGR